MRFVIVTVITTCFKTYHISDIKRGFGVPYIDSKSILLQFKTITPCPVSTGPAKKSFPIVPISALCVNHTTQLGVIHKFAEDALDPAVYVIGEDTEQYWSKWRPLTDTTRH
ncbi:hypothetical protein llap_7540 [Limosa lapponica baueri]|uniref:Uncharacterized protein n=1 Tax=Limosa lapponica baueri TaxID=1758121 RepID=A0A2I0U7W4_LIMLA|nr:hypothetical protein llap_7540 [Limosa lapponica baueri]